MLVSSETIIPLHDCCSELFVDSISEICMPIQAPFSKNQISTQELNIKSSDDQVYCAKYIHTLVDKWFIQRVAEYLAKAYGK